MRYYVMSVSETDETKEQKRETAASGLATERARMRLQMGSFDLL